MPEETQAVDGGEQEPQAGTVADSGNSQAADGGGDAQAGGQEPREVGALPKWAQDLVSELRGENAAHRKAKKEAELAAKKAEEAQLAEQEKWKELAEKRAEELAAVQSQVEALQAAQLRQEVAQEVGLPLELAGRIAGEDREAMLEDARALVKFVKKSEAPDINAGQQTGGDGEPTEDERKAIRSRYRISSR